MATLYQRELRGIWYAAIVLPEGKRLYRSMQTRKKAEAQRRAVAIEAEVEKGKFRQFQEGDSLSVTELFELYIERHSKLNKRSWPRDVTTSKAVGRHLGKLTLSKVRKGHLADYIVKRRKEKATGTTIRLELMTLRHAFKMAQETWEYIIDTPFNGFKLPKANPGRERYLSKKEIDEISKKLPEPMKPIFKMALYTGLRLSNITDLTWSQVDFSERIITIPAESHKNGKPHEVMMNDIVYKLLQEVRSKRTAGKVVELKTSEFVFLNHNGRPYGKNGASEAFRRAVVKAKVKNARFHDCRHTFATALAEKGATAQDLMFAGGWSDISMVMRYTHRKRDRMRHVVGLLD